MRARALRCIGIGRRLVARLAAQRNLATCTCAPIAAFSATRYLLLCGSLPSLRHTFTALCGYRSERAYTAHFATC